jgi:hypothetical protein
MNELDKVMANISQPKTERPSQISELIHRRRNKVLVLLFSSIFLESSDELISILSYLLFQLIS